MGTTSKKGGRMTTTERDFKKSQAKSLYIKGFGVSNISEITGVGIKTLSSWRDADLWDDEKELNALKPSTVRNLTLKCALAIEKGEPLPYKADDVVKIVAAFDRITDSKKKLVYSMESFDAWCDFMLEKAAKSTGAKRQQLLEKVQNARPDFDEYITFLLHQND